jgi:hypothetical protein
MKLRTGKEIGYEISGADYYILFSVNGWWRALRTKEKCDLFMEVIDKYGCKFEMTATEYNPDPETVICRVTDRIRRSPKYMKCIF